MVEFQKLNPPPFKGTIDPLEAENWINEMEKTFDTMEGTEEEKVAFATYMLQGEEYKWWGMEKRRIRGKVTWEDFRRIFLDRHFPTSIHKQKEREFILLEQGKRSMAQYDAAFNRLSNFAPQLVATEIDRAKHFRSGLTPQSSWAWPRVRLKPMANFWMKPFC